MAELLTDAEHAAMDAIADAWRAVCGITGAGPTRRDDLGEMCLHIHALQHYVLAQAAARAYPGKYRLAGETTAGA